MELTFIQDDPWLQPFENVIKRRHKLFFEKKKELTDKHASLSEFASGHLYFGLHKYQSSYIFREWAPNAKQIYLIGTFNNWEKRNDFMFKRIDNENWELTVPISKIQHGDCYRLFIYWAGGNGSRIPAYVRRVVQDNDTKLFNAQIWMPEKLYEWKNNIPDNDFSPLIYEAHVGMSSEEEKVSTFNEFAENILPRIYKAGYNCIQLMAIMEHPYYGSFGYHVANFFAVSSRFGTPDELKKLIDTAHGLGIRVIMDIVHSHSVKNTSEGLAEYDGTPYQFFHSGYRREHLAWDSLCFNYGKNEVIHFLLSNIKYWMEEFHMDGFRFDGVTSMLYLDHGLKRDFNNYSSYYDGGQDEDALTYITLANQLIHELNPNAISIAEEMSGLPGLAISIADGGYGFNYRMAMGIPDFWIKTLKEKKDEDWKVGEIFYELTNKRVDEKVIAYVESHDQALVGDKTLIFWLMDKKMYWNMSVEDQDSDVFRGMALHKMIRLITCATAGGGYLNFMGNEFGHPEWIDFPRKGNNWSYKHARRQWSLVDADCLKYRQLADFDRDMISIIKQTNLLNKPYIDKLLENNDEHILAFFRGELVFVFNFHPSQSFTNYGIRCKKGKYKIILCTDNKEYGGHNRIDANMVYYTSPITKSGYTYQLLLYLPARTAIVLEKQTTKSIYDLKN